MLQIFFLSTIKRFKKCDNRIIVSYIYAEGDISVVLSFLCYLPFV